MKKIISLIILLLLFTIKPAVAVSTLTGCSGGDFGADCSLAELNAGGTIQIDNVLFDNWVVNVAQGSLNLVRVTAIGESSIAIGPGILLEGPAVLTNETIGFEMNYNVSTVGGSLKFTGYQMTMGFGQLLGSANGFAALEITDNVLVDSLNTNLEIANPEPTVDQNTPLLSDFFTNCDNGISVTCPSIPDPAMPRVISTDFRTTTNLEVNGGGSGSINSFTLSQRFSLGGPPPIVRTGCIGGDFGASCSLAELDAGGTIQINDVLFSNWDIDIVQGSLNLIRATPVGAYSSDPGPGVVFSGPGVPSNGSIGFEMRYDVSIIGGIPKLKGYYTTIGFNQLAGNAGGFAAMQLSDKNLMDSQGNDLLIANPEPTVDQVTSRLKDLFTDCDNDISGSCPLVPDPSLPNVVSSNFNVNTNLDTWGGTSGSFDSFDLTQRFQLVGTAICFPIKALNGNVVIICL